MSAITQKLLRLSKCLRGLATIRDYLEQRDVDAIADELLVVIGLIKSEARR